MNATRLTCSFAVVICISLAACSKKPTAQPGMSPPTSAPSSGKVGGGAVSPAEAAVRVFADFYKGANAAEVEVVDSLPIAIPNVPSTRTVKLSIQRPDKLAVRGTGDFSADIIQNGTTTYTVMTPLKKYLETPSAGNFDALAKNPQLLAALGSGAAFIPTLFGDDPYKALMDGVTKVELVGNETVENVECKRLKFERPSLVTEMWVSASGDPLLVKMELPLPIKIGTNKLEVTFKNWKIQKELPAETFAFQPPEGFEKVNDLAGILGGLPALPDVPGGLPQIPGLPELPGGIPGIPGAPPANPAGQPTVPGAVPGVPENLPRVPGNLPTGAGAAPGNPPSPPAGEAKPSGK